MSTKSVAQKLLIKPNTTICPRPPSASRSSGRCPRASPVPTGLSIDEVWSGLRFRPAKKGEAPFAGGRR